MTRFVQTLIVSALCLACAAPAWAERFSLRYDAEDGKFPEEEGWTRWPGDPPEGGGVTRTVSNGVFTINSLASPENADLYWLETPDLMPGPGERLRVDWRMRVLQQEDTGLDWFGDARMSTGRSYGESAKFNLAPDLISVLTPEYFGYQVLVALEPGAWYTYSFLTDMQNYDLFVNGQLLFHSYLNSGKPDIPDPRVVWGDAWSYVGSEAEWDYVQVSIVPEPGGLLVGLVVVLVLLRSARKGV